MISEGGRSQGKVREEWKSPKVKTEPAFLFLSLPNQKQHKCPTLWRIKCACTFNICFVFAWKMSASIWNRYVTSILTYWALSVKEIKVYLAFSRKVENVLCDYYYFYYHNNRMCTHRNVTSSTKSVSVKKIKSIRSFQLDWWIEKEVKYFLSGNRYFFMNLRSMEIILLFSWFFIPKSCHLMVFVPINSFWVRCSKLPTKFAQLEIIHIVSFKKK